MVGAASGVVLLLRVASDAELLPVVELVPLAELVLVDGLLVAIAGSRFISEFVAEVPGV